MSYPLPAMMMPPAKLYKLQSLVTSVFLTKLGYPQTFPWAVVYAASNRGGLGFRHLGYEQGVQKCLQIVKHICADTTIDQVYTLAIQHYQLASGLTQPILEDTWPLPWSQAPWIDQLCSFLHMIHGSIWLNHPGPCCFHGCSIMDDVLAMRVPKWQVCQIQHVHLFLWVTMLSELTEHWGTHILPHILYATPTAQYTQNHTINTSTLQWPHCHPQGQQHGNSGKHSYLGCTWPTTPCDSRCH